jgi:hypothetical protein
MEIAELISNLNRWQWLGLLVAHLLTGLLVCRWTQLGDVIAMLGYNYPVLGLAMLVFAIALWPIGSTVMLAMAYAVEGWETMLEKHAQLRCRYKDKDHPVDSGINTDFQNTPYPNELYAQTPAEKELDRKYFSNYIGRKIT